MLSLSQRLIILCLCSLLSVKASTQALKKDSSLWRTRDLQTVSVVGNNLKRVNSSALNAIAIDVENFKNTNLSLAGILNRISGIKIRETGGLGSSSDINLNGFTGKHVKLFIDGVPMSGASSSFGITNIPASLAGSIEVYKGVVPVEYGADALGGAINIVTTRRRGTILDVSAGYGSFDTYRLSLAMQHTTTNGLLFGINAYRNYSKNSYKVWVQNYQLPGLDIDANYNWYKRFHDTYHNDAIIAEIGVTDKTFADKLSFKLACTKEHADVQTSNLMTYAYGAKYRTSEGITPSLFWSKRNLFIPQLNATLSLRYDITTSNNIDTASRTYNWTGDYIVKSTAGEGNVSLAEYKGKTLAGVLNLRYRMADRHFLSFNSTYTHYRRHTTDNVANASMLSTATFMKRQNIKNVLGLEYKYVGSEHWNALAMLKYYHTRATGPVDTSSIVGRMRYQEQSRSTDALGYGLAGTYHILKGLQAKLSMEHTSRLPNIRELFGDGDFERGNASISPERSLNLNFNLLYEHRFAQQHFISIEAGLNSRNIKDYIIRTIDTNSGYALSTNHGKVRGRGIDLTLRYAYADKFSLNAAYAIQDMRNRERYTSRGAISRIYGDRVPNLPYSFGNADMSYKLHKIFCKDGILTFNYGINYTRKFYRNWTSQGSRLYIPMQVSQDASVVYSFINSTVNIIFEGTNLADNLLYDNYSLQKPGRSFAIKVRYTLYKPDKTYR